MDHIYITPKGKYNLIRDNYMSTFASDSLLDVFATFDGDDGSFDFTDLDYCPYTIDGKNVIRLCVEKILWGTIIVSAPHLSAEYVEQYHPELLL